MGSLLKSFTLRHKFRTDMMTTQVIHETMARDDSTKQNPIHQRPNNIISLISRYHHKHQHADINSLACMSKTSSKTSNLKML